MRLRKYDAKRDANEKAIVDIFQWHGISVFRLDRPLDLLLGCHGLNYLVEVKVEGKKLNKKQQEFTDNWRGQWTLVDSEKQAAELAVNIVKKLIKEVNYEHCKI